MTALFYLGICAFIVGGIGTLIAAFKTSILWGLASLFIAPVSLLFLILHWDVAKKPFFLGMAGLGVALITSSGA